MFRHLVLPALVLPSLIAGYAIAQTPAPARVTIELTVEEQTAWTQVRRAYDTCIAAATLRSDASVCRDIGVFLDAHAAKVAAGVPVSAGEAK